MTNRTIDINGFIKINGNPITKEGVFDYLGSEIGAPDPNRIYKIYRPAEELANEECINSFKGMPFTDKHEFLGPEEEGATPAERKGVHGSIGDNVYFDPPYLRGNINIYSESLKNLISNGINELSAGYRCRYEFTPGMFKGQSYDAIQRHIRCNHLALVEEGRTGPDVAIMDHHFKLTIDSAEIIKMADITPESGGDTSAQIKELLAQLKPLLDQQAETNAILAEFGLGAIAAEPVVADQEKPAATDEEVVVIPEEEKEKIITDEEKAMDTKILRKLEAMDKRIQGLEKTQKAMDTNVISNIAKRDALANKLSNFFGTFDHSSMTYEQVAKYGAEKAGLNKIPAGSEVIALDAWMHGRTPENKEKRYSADSKTSGDSVVTKWLKGGK